MKERLTGAIILVAALVLLVPELLTGPSAKQGVKPAGADGAQLRSYTIDLQDDAGNRQPPTSAPATVVADDPVGRATPETDPDSPAAANVTPPVDDATRAGGRPMGSGADVSAAASERETTAGAAKAGADTAAGANAEDDKPRSAFGPNAVARAAPEKPASATKPDAAKSSEASKPGSAKTDTPRAAPSKPTDASKVTNSQGWAVQLGVFASRDNADRLAREVKGSGYPVVVNEVSGNGKKLYRVRVGPEADRGAAVALSGKLRAAGHAGSVVPYP